MSLEGCAHLAETCQRRPEAPVCASRDPERDLLRVAGSNSATWARTAARRHQRGDPSGALEALHRANTAPGYDGYWMAHVMLFERALAASTDYSYPERIVAAIGITAAMDSIYRELDLLGICENKMADSVEWLRACRDFGKRMEMRENHGGDVESLLFRDANVVSRFVEEFAAHGEFAAMRLVRGEAERLKASLANSRVSGSAIPCFDQRLSPDGVASGDTAQAVGAAEEAPHEVSR